MKTRLTAEELSKMHDPLCGISIGDGPCGCAVHWIEALQKEADASNLQSARLRAVLRSLMVQVETFDPGGCKEGTPYDRLKDARAVLADKRVHHENCDVNDEIIKTKPCNCKDRLRYCVKCGIRVTDGSAAHPYTCSGSGSDTNPAPVRED